MRKTSFQYYLDQLYERFRTLDAGQVADYIPELSRVDPDGFGLALVTVDGHVYQSGDSREAFSIQSISKAFVYGIALEDKGQEGVAAKIDVEPSGEAFNSISLEPVTGRPRNPMINAGAIVATSLVNGDDGESRVERILRRFSDYTGHELNVNESVYCSEKETGHRNRAIAHLLRNYDILEGDPDQPLDAYFRQCAIEVTARDLALMGAALANGGVNPITGVRALQPNLVPRVLAVMATCGMYDYSGNWIFQIGMPAKSGVGGGVVAVLPGQFGLAVYSPRLDVKGNSVRGIAVCEAFSRDFGMHMLKVTRTTTTSVIHSTYTAAEVRSKLNRDAACTEYLQDHGHRILVLELTGDLMFVSAEIVASSTTEAMTDRDCLILDFTRVAAIDQSAAMLLSELMKALIERGKSVLVTGSDRHFAFRQSVRNDFRNSTAGPNLDYTDVDRALESAEGKLLEQAGLLALHNVPVALEKQPLCRNLSGAELALLRSFLEEQRFERGGLICREGEPAEHVYFLESGRVSVVLQLDNRHDHRLGAHAAGWTFGESAFFEGHRRTADVKADSTVRLLRLAPARLRSLDDPVAAGLLNTLLSNLAELNLGRMARSNNEIRILTR
jgi:glutaminase